MAKKLDARRIEKVRTAREPVNTREEEKKRIRETIAKNRRGERRVTVIQPTQKIYAYQNAKKIRVAAYCRVSTVEEAQVGSFEMQVQHFQSVIESNPSYMLVDIYKDEGISGTSMDKRKDFLRMLDDARAGKIDLILTKSISRFGRNIVNILTTLRMLSDLNPPVAVSFESESINTSDTGSKLIISILSALAELESQQKSIAIKEGIRYRMQEGLYRFSVSNTIGYYRDYSGRIKIEPAEAEIVQYIYDSFLEGASFQSIADSLMKQKIRSPRGMDYWYPATIRNILANEKYCGDVRYQKTFSKDYLTHKSVKNKDLLPQWVWENDHPAIIRRDKWQKAQEYLTVRGSARRRVQLEALKKKLTVARIKSGALCGYFLLDATWTKADRMQFLRIVKSLNELGTDNVEPEALTGIRQRVSGPTKERTESHDL
jgi:site-specific DNA recombinase